MQSRKKVEKQANEGRSADGKAEREDYEERWKPEKE